MAQSKIEWTEMTWNPTTGCTKISEGCKNCYAEIMSRRLKAMGVKKYEAGFKVRIHEDQLALPYEWKNSRMVFVDSMSDLFHEQIPVGFIKKVFAVMNNNPQHIFQVLTKRAERLYELHQEFDWTPNIWMGVTVENEKYLSRIDLLRKTNAKVKFLSCEPLLGRLERLNLTAIDWVIVGGESGYNPRPMKPEWVLEIREICKKEKVPFFFKQWGGKYKKKNGRTLDGKTFSEMPAIYHQSFA